MSTKMMREINYYQSRTNLLIPKLCFSRVVREIMGKIDSTLRCKPEALEALQEAAESFLIHYISDANMCTYHAKRVTLMVSDMKLLHHIKHSDAPF